MPRGAHAQTSLDSPFDSPQDVCWAAFRIFDLDGDGKITREDLQGVFTENNGGGKGTNLHRDV